VCMCYFGLEPSHFLHTKGYAPFSLSTSLLPIVVGVHSQVSTIKPKLAFRDNMPNLFTKKGAKLIWCFHFPVVCTHIVYALSESTIDPLILCHSREVVNINIMNELSLSKIHWIGISN